MPSPIMSLSRMAHASPVPAQTMFGIGRRHGERADRLHRLIVEDRRERLPPSVDFQTPPDAAPA